MKCGCECGCGGFFFWKEGKVDDLLAGWLAGFSLWFVGWRRGKGEKGKKGGSPILTAMPPSDWPPPAAHCRISDEAARRTWARLARAVRTSSATRRVWKKQRARSEGTRRFSFISANCSPFSLSLFLSLSLSLSLTHSLTHSLHPPPLP